jgi:ABC-type antimicrobial peptide transport system permease subunit
MGIRMALGARSSDVLMMIVREGMTPAVVGLCCGLGASLAAGRLLSGLLYGVAAVDTVTITGVVLTLMAVAALASLIPARRATLVDPVTTLRYE